MRKCAHTRAMPTHEIACILILMGHFSLLGSRYHILTEILTYPPSWVIEEFDMLDYIWQLKILDISYWSFGLA